MKQNRRPQLTIRVDLAEREQVKARARKAGLTLDQYARKKLGLPVEVRGWTKPKSGRATCRTTLYPVTYPLDPPARAASELAD